MPIAAAVFPPCHVTNVRAIHGVLDYELPVLMLSKAYETWMLLSGRALSGSSRSHLLKFICIQEAGCGEGSRPLTSGPAPPAGR